LRQLRRRRGPGTLNGDWPYLESVHWASPGLLKRIKNGEEARKFPGWSRCSEPAARWQRPCEASRDRWAGTRERHLEREAALDVERMAVEELKRASWILSRWPWRSRSGP